MRTARCLSTHVQYAKKKVAPGADRIRGAGLALVLLLLAVPRSARLQAGTPQSLADASIEDLMNVEVTSVSRKEQKLSRTAAAVYVITQEEIRRSGATNIPDILRMAPGVD